MPRQPRWPDAQAIIERAERGIIDDTTALVPPYDLEDWEILGEPEPEAPAVRGDGPRARRAATPQAPRPPSRRPLKRLRPLLEPGK